MTEYFIDAMGARFGRAFLPEDAVMSHPEAEAPEMAQYRRLLADHGISHEAGRLFLLRTWEALVPHLIGGLPYDEDELVSDLAEASAELFGQPPEDAARIAARVGLATDYGRD